MDERIAPRATTLPTPMSTKSGKRSCFSGTPYERYACMPNTPVKSTCLARVASMSMSCDRQTGMYKTHLHEERDVHADHVELAHADHRQDRAHHQSSAGADASVCAVHDFWRPVLGGRAVAAARSKERAVRDQNCR